RPVRKTTAPDRGRTRPARGTGIRPQPRGCGPPSTADPILVVKMLIPACLIDPSLIGAMSFLTNVRLAWLGHCFVMWWSRPAWKIPDLPAGQRREGVAVGPATRRRDHARSARHRILELPARPLQPTPTRPTPDPLDHPAIHLAIALTD